MLRSHSWIAATLRSDTLTAKLVAHSTPHVSRRGRQAGGRAVHGALKRILRSL